MNNLYTASLWASLISIVFILFLIKNRKQAYSHFPKEDKLLSLSFNEIYLLKDELLGTTFPFMSNIILFHEFKRELLINIENSLQKEKFLSNLINCIEVIYDYNFSRNKTKSLIGEVFFRYSWVIFQEIESYEKPEKTHIIISLMNYFQFINDKKFIFIEDELRIKLACLIVGSTKLIKDHANLIPYLGKDEIEMIEKFKAA